jgi:hypothetical protein
VTWPDQREQYLDGFGSFAETVEWVQNKSQAWLEAQQINAIPSSPRRHDHIWSRFELAISPEPSDAPSCPSNSALPDPRVIGAIDQLINVLDMHREAAKEDRRSRGEAFKDEKGPK